MSRVSSRNEPLMDGKHDDPVTFAMTLYVRFLKGLFNFMPKDHFHWEPDNEATEIVIRAQAPLDMKTVGERPAITVVMGPVQWAGLAINNMVEMNLSTGKALHSDLLSGYLVIYCLGNNDTVANRLANIVNNYTKIHRSLLESAGGFHQIARPSGTVNAPSVPGQLVSGDAEGLVMCQVNIPFQMQWSWYEEPGRQSPQHRSLAMILQEDRAIDFPYTSPRKLERVQLAISTVPVLVKRLNGSRGSVTYTEIGEGIKPFQISDLRPFGEEK